jgi:hypothetical protein
MSAQTIAQQGLSIEYPAGRTVCSEDKYDTLTTLSVAPWRWPAYFIALLLGGYLLVAHGCHGDEDNELFAGVFLPPAAEGSR